MNPALSFGSNIFAFPVFTAPSPVRPPFFLEQDGSPSSEITLTKRIEYISMAYIPPIFKIYSLFITNNQFQWTPVMKSKNINDISFSYFKSARGAFYRKYDGCWVCFYT